MCNVSVVKSLQSELHVFADCQHLQSSKAELH